MIKKTTLLTMILLLCFKGIFADPINEKTAIVAANNWMNSKSQNGFKSNQKKITSIDEVYHNERVVYYIMNFKNGGFVIVSADDSTKPILAYSETASFDARTENSTTNNLLNAYKSFVYESAVAQKTSKRKSTNSGWNKLLKSKSQNQLRAKVVAPFMDDILYTQSRGFEKFCPSDADGQAIVGCVATAMSQVMRYWEFPSTGKGEMTYNHRKYGTLSVNFENQHYDWDNMSKTTADDENAKLSYHTGVAVKMNYGTSENGGSGAYTRNALAALKNNFKYNNGARMVYRYNYSDQEWSNVIKNQLDEKRPVLYSGRSNNLEDPTANSAGHLFALDGYDTTDQGDFFHINWGWAGKSNGYFYLTEMITHGGKYNWINNNAIMINLYPTNVAPLYTSNPSTFTRINDDYEYAISVTDENRKDVIEVTLMQGPSWLTLKLENGKYLLQGTPSESDSGSHKIVINATDGSNNAKQEFDLVVLKSDEEVDTLIIDFETADFSQANFSNNGSFPFTIENNNNHFSQSSNINDNQESNLSLVENFLVSTTLKFDYKVSSESNYDFLIFKIDGNVVNKWSGEKDWTTVSFNIPSGEHTLTWSYKKDNSVKKGQDLAMIDNIVYTSIISGSSVDYCESKGNGTDYEWIDFVSFGDMTNSTGKNNGYANFTDKIATVVSGSTNNLVLSAGFSGSTYTEYFSVWIDYNQNGDFEENESVVNASIRNADNNTYAVTIPDTALLGSTRMRVSMKYEQTQTSCEAFNYGEVEDYTVNITNALARKSTDKDLPITGMQLYPNPSSKFLNIKIEKALKNAQYQIIDLSGKTVDQNSFSPLINIESLKTGMYFIKIFDQNTTYSKSFIKSIK